MIVYKVAQTLLSILVLLTITMPFAPSVSASQVVVFSDDFESSSGWRRSGGIGDAFIAGNVFSSASRSLWIGADRVSATSPRINASSTLPVQNVYISAWIRRGFNSLGSDYPEAGEDLIVQYYSASGTWIELERFPGGEAAGEVFRRSYALPPSEATSSLEIRFTLTNGSGRGFDYWHIDDVVVTLHRPPVTTGPVYRISGNSRPFSMNNSNWAWDGSELAPFRSAAENPAYFGPNGLIKTTVDTIDLASITASSLADIDAFIASWWTDGDSSTYRTTLQNWHLSGGDLVLLQDDAAHDAVGAQLGFSTSGNSMGPTTISGPLQSPTGPFGTVDPLAQIGEFGSLNETAVIAARGTACGRDSSGRITVACWGEGEFAPGAGKLVIATDVDFITGNFGGASYNPVNDKGRFGLNLVAFLLSKYQSKPVAHLAFEQSGWNGAGVIIDDYADQGRAGISVGAVSSAARGYICRGATVPDNVSSAVTDAIDTRVDVDDVLGAAGSVSFWWKASANWNDGRSRTLFDATQRRINSNQDKYFYLAKEANGSLLFSFEDSVDADFYVRSGVLGFLANQWVHLVVTWDYQANKTAIYANGQLVGSGNDNTSGIIPSDLGTLYFGDNSSSYASPGNSAAGVLDEIMLFNRVLEPAEIGTLNSATRKCDICALGSFDLLQPQYGLACPSTRMAVDIIARCDDGTPFTEYAGTVNLRTSASAASTVYTTESGGAAVSSLTFDGTEGGRKRVYLHHSNETPDLRLTATDAQAGISSTAIAATDVRTTGLAVTGGQNFSCGRSIDLQLTAIGQTDDGSGRCSIISGFQGAKTFKSWYRMNLDINESPPVADTVSSSLLINESSITAQSTPASANLTLNFSSGTARASLGYSDVGQLLSLNFLHDAAPYNGSAPELMPLLGSTGTMVISPAAFTLALPAGHECAAGNASCTPFVPAAADFTHTVSARCTTSSGVPGAVATQYRGTAAFTHTLVAPAGGEPGTLRQASAAFTAASGGQATIANQALSEVGVFRLSASPSAYFGVSYPAVESIVGRIYPAFLRVLGNKPRLQLPAACSFAFQAQPLSYLVNPELQVSGFNRQNGLTRNYAGEFFRLGDPAPVYINTAVTGSVLTPDLALRSYSRSTSPASPGQTTIALRGDTMSYMRAGPRPAASDAPFVAAFNLDFPAGELTDGDGACNRINAAGGCLPYQMVLDSSLTPLQLVYGRMRMENAFGPELADLVVPLRSEYWSGGNWLTNDQDSCSIYDTTQVSLNDFTGGLSPASTGAKIGAAAPATRAFAAGLHDATAPLLLTRPTAAQTGTVRLTHTVPDWLKFDWNGNGTANDPSAIATFGQYRGHDRIIYWRELLH